MALGWVLATWLPSCVLIGYDPEAAPPRSVDHHDAGPLGPDGGLTDFDATLPPPSDASTDAADAAPELDAQPMPVLDASTDTGVLYPDGGTEECPDGGCACPPNGNACAGDLWLTCDENSQVVTTVNCRDQVTSQCQEGMCDPTAGCVSGPALDDTACDDGLFCTAVDACKSGSCVGSGSPCPDNVCITQSCDETNDKCVVDAVNNGVSCGAAQTCSSDGTCVSDSNCSTTCNPQCTGTNATCDLPCHGADSCDTTCLDNQICNVDCHDTDSCEATCNGANSDCNMDCQNTGSCTGNCTQSSCDLDCHGSQDCQNHCSGTFGNCTSTCDGSDDCGVECKAGSHCTVSSCNGGTCGAHCEDKSRCDMKCDGADRCEASCSQDSTCVVDCRGADSCGVACSYTSQCFLRCDPFDPHCYFTECWGGAYRCPNGYLVCHAFCPF